MVCGQRPNNNRDTNESGMEINLIQQQNETINIENERMRRELGGIRERCSAKMEEVAILTAEIEKCRRETEENRVRAVEAEICVLELQKLNGMHAAEKARKELEGIRARVDLLLSSQHRKEHNDRTRWSNAELLEGTMYRNEIDDNCKILKDQIRMFQSQIENYKQRVSTEPLSTLDPLQTPAIPQEPQTPEIQDVIDAVYDSRIGGETARQTYTPSSNRDGAKSMKETGKRPGNFDFRKFVADLKMDLNGEESRSTSSRGSRSHTTREEKERETSYEPKTFGLESIKSRNDSQGNRVLDSREADPFHGPLISDQPHVRAGSASMNDTFETNMNTTRSDLLNSPAVYSVESRFESCGSRLEEDSFGGAQSSFESPFNDAEAKNKVDLPLLSSFSREPEAESDDESGDSETGDANDIPQNELSNGSFPAGAEESIQPEEIEEADETFLPNPSSSIVCDQSAFVAQAPMTVHSTRQAPDVSKQYKKLYRLRRAVAEGVHGYRGIPAVLDPHNPLFFYGVSQVRQRFPGSLFKQQRLTVEEMAVLVIQELIPKQSPAPPPEHSPWHTVPSSKARPAVNRIVGAPSSWECSICFNPQFEKTHRLHDLESCIFCSKVFHSKCLSDWLRTNATCPLCRKHIRPSSDFPSLF